MEGVCQADAAREKERINGQVSSLVASIVLDLLFRLQAADLDKHLWLYDLKFSFHSDTVVKYATGATTPRLYPRSIFSADR